MRNSRRYRDATAGCLSAAIEASQPCYRRLHLSMAVSWLSLAHRDKERPAVLASRVAVEPLKLQRSYQAQPNDRS
jgi:hypothetical protein